MKQDVNIIKYQSELMRRTLCLMGKFIRNNPPQKIPNDFAILNLFTEDFSRDPEGYEIINYFLKKSKEEMDKENKK